VTQVTEKTAAVRDGFEMMEKIRIGAGLQGKIGTRQPANASGFSLVEMMITVLILSILASIVIPNMRDATRSYQLTSRASYWLNVLNYARSEATKRGSRITLCASSDGASCAGSSQSNLHQGWIIFVDTDNDGTWDAGEIIVRPGSADSEYTYVLSGTSNSYVSFISNGMTKTAGNASWSGNITICREAGELGRQVVISPVGRTKMDNVGC